ncbi:M23 family metallopeptidase [Rhodococcus gannanensis]|uniref:M23 family metallopeptidase n=1 Tax=Rhodococcus gannanensis TaxID=1960308 RepID=A0ABW4PA60_9NOCA
MRLVSTFALVAALLLAGPADAATSGFVWPLRPRPVVLTPFDPPARDWLPGHRGVDLAGVAGRSVLAAGDGVVAFAGVVAGKPVVSIDHQGGLRTTYEPVEAEVRAGARVSAGSRIGTLVDGHEDCPTACLHWGVRRGRDEYLDPLALVRAMPVRLKPLHG